MLKIGIIGAGQAGQRIAVALSSFEDVSIVGIVDPKNGRQILTDPCSPWRIPGVKFFDLDDEMLAEEYDAIVLAADPISVSHAPLRDHRKMMMLARNKVSCPILCMDGPGLEVSHPYKQVFPLNPWAIASLMLNALTCGYAASWLDLKSEIESMVCESRPYIVGILGDFCIYVLLGVGFIEDMKRGNSYAQKSADSTIFGAFFFTIICTRIVLVCGKRIPAVQKCGGFQKA